MCSLLTERKVLFPLNSHFEVVDKLNSLALKQQALSDLGAYDISDVDVYKLKQI